MSGGEWQHGTERWQQRRRPSAHVQRTRALRYIPQVATHELQVGAAGEDGAGGILPPTGSLGRGPRQLLRLRHLSCVLGANR